MSLNAHIQVPMSSTSTTSTINTNTTNKGWKKQLLVGKMWEIYWDPNGNGTKTKQTQSNSKSSVPIPSPTSTDNDNSEDSESDLEYRYGNNIHVKVNGNHNNNNKNDESEYSYDADWYDAHVRSYSPENDIFEVSFVGEEKIWKMALAPTIVRPLEGESSLSAPITFATCSSDTGCGDVNRKGDVKGAQRQSQMDRDWKDSIIGKDWEIFWESSSNGNVNDHTGIHDESDNENESFCSDWYDAHIQSYNAQTDLFQISFLGEDHVYDMKLTPTSKTVRPSLRAWVKRTKFILDLTADQVTVTKSALHENRHLDCVKSGLDRMPHLTRRFDHASNVTKGEEKTVNMDLDDMGKDVGMDINMNMTSIRMGRKFDLMCYQQLLKEQLDSKKYLQFAASDDSLNNTETVSMKNNGGARTPTCNNIVENSREHVEYLIGRIQLVLESCAWYHSTQALGAQIHKNRYINTNSSDNDTKPSIGIEELHCRVFNGVVLFIRTLLFDSNKRGSNHHKRGNKRPRPLSDPSSRTFVDSPSKRANKRRITTTRKIPIQSKDFTLDRDSLMNEVAECEESCTHTDMDTDILWTNLLKHLNLKFGLEKEQYISSELIGIILQRCSDGRSCRYLSRELADCVIILLQRTWASFVEWIGEVRAALGTVYTKEFDRLEGKMAGFPTLQFMRQKKELTRREQSCCLDTISNCIMKCRDNKMLQRINLSGHISYLQRKVSAITELQHRIWERIARGIYEPVSFPGEALEHSRDEIHQNDPVILELTTILQHPACLDSSISKNIATKINIQQAINLRKWVILYRWVMNSGYRERSCTISSVSKDYTSLLSFHLPAKYSAIYDEEIGKKMIGQLNDLCMKIELVAKNKVLEGVECESTCRQLLNEWSEADSALHVEEEKCAVLADMYAWNDLAKSRLSSNASQVNFELIALLHGTLRDIKRGMCITRSKLTQGLIGAQDVDDEIRSFIKEKMSFHCREMELLVTGLYNKGNAWSRRANHVLRSLRHYGNESINMSIHSNVSTKVNNLIDLRGIGDLLQEADTSLFIIPDVKRDLQQASHDANKWADECLTLISTDFKSSCPAILLQKLRETCLKRPKGIVMFPSRQLVGEWIELLVWYKQCTQAFDLLKVFHKKKIADGELTNEKVALDIAQANNEVEVLLRKGYELINMHPQAFNSFHIDYSTLYNERCLQHFKSATAISLEKMEACGYSNTLLRSLIKRDEKLKSNGNFFLLQLFVWRHLVSNLLGKIGQNSRRKRQQGRPILSSAKVLFDSIEHLPEPLESLSKADSLLDSIYSAKYLPLKSIICEAETTTAEATEALAQINSKSRTIVHLDFVKDLLTRYKSIRSSIRRVNEDGLGINADISSEIEKRIRDLHWMKSALSCPTISDAKYSSARRGVIAHSDTFISDSYEKRVPLSFLLQLYDKAPSQCRSEANTDSCSLDVAMASTYHRICSVKDQFMQWQAEVHAFMPRSVRFIKRRETQSRYLAEDSLQDYKIVSEDDIRTLKQHPLLRNVSIPEEEALAESLSQTIIIREKLIFLFATDCSAHDVERVALPSYASLLGKDGDFFLNKIIHHPLYHQLNTELAAIENHAKNMSVRTFEKVTYDWVQNMMSWIELVASKMFVPSIVDKTSPLDRLCISLNDTKSLIDEGHRLFFSITDESKKYLLKHRLSVVTRESTGNVTVKRCKGGSNLSTGGTILRFVAFCYNSLRNDFASTMHWMKKADTLLQNENLSSGSKVSFRDLIQDAQENLVVAPDLDLLRKITEKGKEYDHGTVREEKCTFVHNLLMKREKQSVNSSNFSATEKRDEIVHKSHDMLENPQNSIARMS